MLPEHTGSHGRATGRVRCETGKEQAVRRGVNLDDTFPLLNRTAQDQDVILCLRIGQSQAAWDGGTKFLTDCRMQTHELVLCRSTLDPLLVPCTRAEACLSM